MPSIGADPAAEFLQPPLARLYLHRALHPSILVCTHHRRTAKLVSTACGFRA